MSAAPLVRTCVLDEAAIRIDYTTGTVRAANGSAGRAWAKGADVVVALSRAPVFGAEEAVLEPSALSAPRPIDAIGAGTALATVLAAREVGSATGATHRILRAIAAATRLTRRPATDAEAARVVGAVRWVARWAPARIACLEESAGAMVLLAVQGRRATWCHGVAPDPVEFHAWIETDGTPVAEPRSTSRFTALLTI